MMSSNKLTLIAGGNHSQVWTYGQDNQLVVLKVVSSKNRRQQLHLKNQFEVLQNLHHRNVIKSLRYRQNVAFQGNKTDKQLQTGTHNILVLQHANRGTLLQQLRTNNDINSKRQAFRQIAQALHYLHTEGIAHRDVKLQNILVFEQDGENIYKISDFGFASKFQQGKENIKYNQYKGTKKGYMAPEIHQCQKDKTESYDATKTDVFALGVILFALVFRHLPFEYAEPNDPLYRLIVDKKLPAFWTHHNSTKLQMDPDFRMEELKDLFARMVSKDPEQRPSMQEVLKNGWLSK